MSEILTRAQIAVKSEDLRVQLQEMADTISRENRVRTPEEEARFNDLSAQMQELQVRSLDLAARDMSTVTGGVQANAYDAVTVEIRDCVSASRSFNGIFHRDTLTTDSLGTSGAFIGIKQGDVVEPLREGFILDKVGLPLYTGLVGSYVWPAYTKISAAIYAEGVAIGDGAITFSSLTATPERIGVAVPVSRESLYQSEGLVEAIVRKELPLSLQDFLNQVIASPTKLSGATHLVGPFVGAEQVTLSSTPTAKELNAMKAAIYAEGIPGKNMCWVMSKAMEATLEVTPINSDGVFIPMIQNHTLLGLPVYTTSYIEGYIGIGDWAYQPMGLFGDINFTVDPYTLARQNSIDFVLNANYATKTLRQEAFRLGVVSA